MGGYGIVGGNAAARRRDGPRGRLPGRGRRHRLHVRRRRIQRRQLRRDDEPGRAVDASGRLPRREQPLRDGNLDRAPLGGDGPFPQGGGLRRPRRAGRRHGRTRGARDGRRAHPDGARGPQADPGRGLHLPLPRPLRRRPRGLPEQGGGRGVAGEGPGRDLRCAARRRGRAERGGRRGDQGRGRAHRARGRRVRRRLARARRSTPSTTTSTSSASQVPGWYAVDERSPDPHPGEDEREARARGGAQELRRARAPPTRGRASAQASSGGPRRATGAATEDDRRRSDG